MAATRTTIGIVCADKPARNGEIAVCSRFFPIIIIIIAVTFFKFLPVFQTMRELFIFFFIILISIPIALSPSVRRAKTIFGVHACSGVAASARVSVLSVRTGEWGRGGDAEEV